MKTDHYGQVIKNPDGSIMQEDVIAGPVKETPSSGSERRLVMLDDAGDEVTDRDEIMFSYGIPPVRVCAQVEAFEGELWALTPGHNPSRCRLLEIREHVGCFYKA